MLCGSGFVYCLYKVRFICTSPISVFILVLLLPLCLMTLCPSSSRISSAFSRYCSINVLAISQPISKFSNCLNVIPSDGKCSYHASCVCCLVTSKLQDRDYGKRVSTFFPYFFVLPTKICRISKKNINPHYFYSVV